MSCSPPATSCSCRGVRSGSAASPSRRRCSAWRTLRVRSPPGSTPRRWSASGMPPSPAAGPSPGPTQACPRLLGSVARSSRPMNWPLTSARIWTGWCGPRWSRAPGRSPRPRWSPHCGHGRARRASMCGRNAPPCRSSASHRSPLRALPGPLPVTPFLRLPRPCLPPHPLPGICPIPLQDNLIRPRMGARPDGAPPRSRPGFRQRRARPVPRSARGLGAWGRCSPRPAARRPRLRCD